MIYNKFYLTLLMGLLFVIPTICPAQKMDFAKKIELVESDFQELPENWTNIGDIQMGLNGKDDFIINKGTGIFLNIPKNNHQEHLVTSFEHGDIEIYFDFMMAKGSNSGVYLQGRYEIQMYDSWEVVNPQYSDAGGIYKRWDDERSKGNERFEGHAPFINVSKAPGLWQNFRIKFQAPKFDEDGKKISNAKFVEVYHNGVLVQQNFELTGPTRASIFDNEKPNGPIVIQGDHGIVAIKNLAYKIWNENEKVEFISESLSDSQEFISNTVIDYPQPQLILENAKIETVMQRGFYEKDDKKYTHVITVSEPGAINYAYNTEDGRILDLWRGDFINVTTMWHSRGFQQLMEPMGSKISITSNSYFLKDKLGEERLPFVYLGYDITDKGRPVFKSKIGSYLIIKDSMAFNGKKGLERHLQIDDLTKSQQSANFVVLNASKIVKHNNNLYTINNNEFYVYFDDESNIYINNNTDGSQSLVISINLVNDKGEIKYAIIW